MTWLVLIRSMVKRHGLRYRVEGPMTFGVPISAPDRPTAESKLPPDSRLAHYSVVAACSWSLMRQRERDNILAPAAPPPHPQRHPTNPSREERPDADA